MFAEINREALHSLPFVLNTLGESPHQSPLNRPEGNNFHDARYDTVAVYLAINKGLEREEALQSIREFL